MVWRYLPEIISMTLLREKHLQNKFVNCVSIEDLLHCIKYDLIILNYYYLPIIEDMDQFFSVIFLLAIFFISLSKKIVFVNNQYLIQIFYINNNVCYIT